MNDFLEIKFTELKQFTNNTIGFCVIPYREIKEVIKFTERISDEEDPFADKAELQKDKERTERYYQRLRESSKVIAIKNFILKELVRKYKYEKKVSMSSPLGTFPTSVMLAVNLFNTDNESTSFEEYKGANHNGSAYLDKELKTLQIPHRESVLVVDGQHRIAGLNSLLSDIKSKNVKFNKKNIQEVFDASIYTYLERELLNFEFLCILLIDFDLFEQGEIFANTNFNQKPVNRSIYYDIFGTSPNTEKNSLKLAHDIVAHLNYSPKSALVNRIKMLGTGDGLISQAAMVEFFIALFSPKKVWGPIYSDYLNNGSQYKYVTIFIRAYLDALKEVFNKYWPKEEEVTSKQYGNILCKTTGLGATIKLIEKLYPYIKEFEKDVPDIMKDDEKIKKELVKKLNEVADNGGKYFSGEEGIGDYSKGAGKGLQSKLYYQMALDLGFMKPKTQANDKDENFK